MKLDFGKFRNFLRYAASVLCCVMASPAVAENPFSGKPVIAPVQGLEVYKSFCFSSSGSKSGFKKAIKSNTGFSSPTSDEFAKIISVHKTDSIKAQIGRDNECSVIFVTNKGSEKSVATIKAALPTVLGVNSPAIKFTRQRTHYKTGKGTVSVINYDMFISNAVALTFFK